MEEDNSVFLFQIADVKGNFRRLMSGLADFGMKYFLLIIYLICMKQDGLPGVIISVFIFLFQIPNYFFYNFVH